MKTLERTQSRSIFYYFLIFLFALVSTGFSQTNHFEKIDVPENKKSNYLNGITSDNLGLKSSSIYFAGRYRISEASEMLLEELKNSEEEKLTLLIAWSIYRIGNECCMDELKEIAETHTSDKLKIFCLHLNQLEKFELALESSKQP